MYQWGGPLRVVMLRFRRTHQRGMFGGASCIVNYSWSDFRQKQLTHVRSIPVVNRSVPMVFLNTPRWSYCTVTFFSARHCFNDAMCMGVLNNFGRIIPLISY